MATAKQGRGWDCIAAMNRAKDSKPGSGGRVYKAPKRPKTTPEKGTWERLKESTRFAWECHAGLAIEDYMRAVYPERYDVDAFNLGRWL